MSKVASYLQEHISGEVSVNPYVLDAMSRDGSVLQSKPEIVVYPRSTNDVRKIARFSWQLAERGHTLSITARGGGNDRTGAAIGKGIVLSFPAHMNHIFEFEPRRKLVRVQPGVSARSLSDALLLHGARIPALDSAAPGSTVGGAVANNVSSQFSGKYGRMIEWVDQLEIVLANGEVIQTGRISRRELNRKKGFETLEGEIYRSIDNLIEDNKDMIAELSARCGYTNAGYVSIASVKRRDGSFDLTPLFLGSQGTLGVISEMILRADYLGNRLGVVLAVFSDKETARDAIPALSELGPAFVDYFDGDLIELAKKAGKQFIFSKNTEVDVGAALLIGFDDQSDRRRKRKLKKTGKLLNTLEVWFTTANGEGSEDLTAIRDVLAWSALPDKTGQSAPPILNGIYVPPEQFAVFSAGLSALATKNHIKLPIFGREMNSIYFTWPVFDFRKTSDKQKALKLIDDIALLIEKTEGELVGESGEGRLKSRFVERSFDDDTQALFRDVKKVFDPYDILNPGVKQSVGIKELASMMRSDYRPASLPNYTSYV